MAGRDAERGTPVHRIPPGSRFHRAEPGQAATDAIRKAAADLNSDDIGARVRLTGPVPIADEEFATVQEGALINTASPPSWSC